VPLCGGNFVGMPRYHWPACLEQEDSAPVGCSKSSSGKAAGESKPEAYPQGYVEDFDEPRTKLADFFSILLWEERNVE
jgi:hypothetical protein